MKKTVLSLISILAMSPFSFAGGDIIQEEPVTEVIEESTWDFRLSPYVWLAGFKGDVASVPELGGDPIYVDISASDAVSDTEESFMAMFEGKKEGKGFFVDFFYSDIQSEEALFGGIKFILHSTTKTTMFSGGYLHEVYNQDNSVVDILAGVRYWDIDTRLTFGGRLGILPGRTIDHTETWVDPLIGIKGRTSLGDTKFYATGVAAIGGFGLNSDLFYELNANLGYQWSESIGTTVGYRMYDLDYEKDGFVYDVRQQGWIAGLTWAF